MNTTAQEAQTIANFLQVFTSCSNLRLRYRVKVRGARPTSEQKANAAPANPEPKNASLLVEFSGPDTPILLARNGEVLNALEHVAAQILRLHAEEHDRVLFDAEHFKADRDRQMRDSAAVAIRRVHATGSPHAFAAMSSRERRMLHMILGESGLPTASSGEGAGRFVVLYPAGADTSEPYAAEQVGRRPDPNGVRKAFRPR